MKILLYLIAPIHFFVSMYITDHISMFQAKPKEALVSSDAVDDSIMIKKEEKSDEISNTSPSKTSQENEVVLPKTVNPRVEENTFEERTQFQVKSKWDKYSFNYNELVQYGESVLDDYHTLKEIKDAGYKGGYGIHEFRIYRDGKIEYVIIFY